MSGEYNFSPKPETPFLARFEATEPGLERLKFISENGDRIRAERQALKEWSAKNANPGPRTKEWRELRKQSPFLAAQFAALHQNELALEWDIKHAVEKESRR